MNHTLHFSTKDAELVCERFRILLSNAPNRCNPEEWTVELGRSIHKESQSGDYRPKNGGPSEEAYDYVARETHYALERDGFKWNNTTQKLFPELKTEDYNSMRTRVVQALTDRAFDFWVHNHTRQPQDHIRCDLKPYLDHPFIDDHQGLANTQEQ
ncbi:MAG: hypothetical protein AABY00_02005 [Nanoarchaeota archaeon]